MRRSIAYCEPAFVLAGSKATLHFHFQPATALPKGARLRFDMANAGREIDWETPTTDAKAKQNVIYGILPDDSTISPKEVDAPQSVVPFYEFTLPKGIKAGETFTIVLGAPRTQGKGAKSQGAGTRVQTYVQRRKPFHLHVDPKGKGKFESTEDFSIDIRGNTLYTLRILTPSLVARNKRFDVVIRFEDAFGNLTGHAPEGTLVDLSYENLRENLNWKLFVPETGFVALPNLYFNEPGVYRLRLENLKTKEVFLSSPVKCLMEADHTIYWGMLHGESEKVDSGEGIENCLRHWRDDAHYNFVATSPFESAQETSNDIWRLVSNNVATFNEEDRFTAILGFQWKGESPAEGVRHMIYSKDGKALLRQKDLKYNSLKKLYRIMNAKDLMSIPCFTMSKEYGYDFADFNAEFERVVEIYNAWGSSECTAAEGNLRPIVVSGKKASKEYAAGSIRKALAANCRFGFVAGGLDDRGIYAGFYEGNQTQYSPGLTAVLSDKHNRESILAALQRRACYATTGARIILGFTLSGTQMGTELSTQNKPGLVVNRHIAGYVAGVSSIDRVEIIRNGELIKEFKVDKEIFDFTYDDMDDLKKAAFPAKGDAPPFVYYYIRVIQKDEEMAWSSPVWIDLVPPKNSTPAKKAKKG